MPASDRRRILITGATGFVGASLTRRMVECGHEVHALVRPHNSERDAPAPAWRIAEILKEIRVHLADLLDAEAVRWAAALARPHVVLHFAAHSALHHETDEGEILLHTVQPLVNLASACAGCELFINAGSSSEYGYQTEPMSESSPPNPTRVHDIAKLTQTLYGAYAARFKGLPLVTLRLFSVYGPWEHERRLIPRLILAALKGRPMNLSSPSVSRDFIYVGDVVQAVEHCLQRPIPVDETIFNLGTGVEHSIGEVANILEEIHGRPLLLNWGAVERQRWDSPRWVADTTRQTTKLGFAASTDLREGLSKTYRWFVENAHRFEEYEQRA